MYRSLCLILVLFVVSESTVIRNVSNAEADNGFAEKQRLILECIQTNNITADAFVSNFLSKLLSTLHSGIGDLQITDPKEQCILGCLMGLEMLKPDGTAILEIMNDATKQYENGNEIVEELKKCAVLPTDGCENTFRVGLCVDRALKLGKIRAKH